MLAGIFISEALNVLSFQCETNFSSYPEKSEIVDQMILKFSFYLHIFSNHLVSKKMVITPK
jgi:hypothetical protein